MTIEFRARCAKTASAFTHVCLERTALVTSHTVSCKGNIPHEEQHPGTLMLQNCCIQLSAELFASAGLRQRLLWSLQRNYHSPGHPTRACNKWSDCFRGMCAVLYLVLMSAVLYCMCSFLTPQPVRTQK